MEYGTWRGLEVGKTYRFSDGRRGKVLNKKDSGRQSAGKPMVQIEWRD